MVGNVPERTAADDPDYSSDQRLVLALIFVGVAHYMGALQYRVYDTSSKFPVLAFFFGFTKCK